MQFDTVKFSAKRVAVIFLHDDYKVLDVPPVSYRLQAKFTAELEGSPQIRLDPLSQSQMFTTLNVTNISHFRNNFP